MNDNLIPIGKTAKLLGVSVDTLRRWDKSGKFPSVRMSGGNRYYNLQNIEKYLANLKVSQADLFSLANYWASSKNAIEPDEIFYCQNSAIFQARIIKMEKGLAEIPDLKDKFPLIVAVAGEIGNNSFDHNIGNWPDVPGIFFGYDVRKRQIVLADRGQGILKTLRRVRPGLLNDRKALEVAFTEIISGRAPESRGNGLKFVRRVIFENDMKLYFQSGSAELLLKKGYGEIKVKKSNTFLRGCIAQIKF